MQLPTPQHHAALGKVRQQRQTRATAGGASAAILAAAGASTLLPTAAAQAQNAAPLTAPTLAAFTPTPTVADVEAAQTSLVSELAAEPVLLSSLGTQAAPTMAPGGIAPLAAPGGVLGAMPAVSLLGETSELAQTSRRRRLSRLRRTTIILARRALGRQRLGRLGRDHRRQPVADGTVAGVGGAYLPWRSLNRRRPSNTRSSTRPSPSNPAARRSTGTEQGRQQPGRRPHLLHRGQRVR